MVNTELGRKICDKAPWVHLRKVDKLARFADFFHLTVNFACLDLDRPEQFYWVPLRGLVGRTPERRGKVRVLTYPLDEAFVVSLSEPFLQASMRLWQGSLC